jgi:hypothetical protein
MEIWKPIFNGLYEVSSEGRVRRMAASKGATVGQVLKPKRLRHGYLCVLLCAHSQYTQRTIHSLVAEAFIGQRPPNHDVNHKDGDRGNNRLENLEYLTRKENCLHASRRGSYKFNAALRKGECNGRARITQHIAGEMRRLRSKGIAVQAIAERYEVGKHIVEGVIYRRTWNY